MKNFVTIVVLLAISLGCSSQNGSKSQNDEVQFVKNFYIQYEAMLNLQDNFASQQKCDSLCKLYCTNELASLIQKENGNGVGYDFMTADYGIKKCSISSLSVKPFGGAYMVAYETSILAPNNRFENRMVRLRVLLKREAGALKIAKVEELE